MDRRRQVQSVWSAFTEFKQRYYWMARILSEVTWSISSINRYHQRVEELYLNTSINVNAIEEHRRCSDALNETVDVFDIYETIAELAVNMTRSDSVAEAYSYVIQIPPLLKMTNALFTNEKVTEIDRNVTQNVNGCIKLMRK